MNKKIVIPSELDGIPVATIGKYAFSSCNDMTIKTSKGSYAEEYANQKGIAVKLM